ncbi:MAG: hypothetical protein U5K31_08100 [Balneolaceae bacterium]|nr:hypothetical protein [Balneolaceae bacterium]
MKTHAARSILILFIIAVISGCELNPVDSPDPATITEEISTETIAREIGRLHNAGLDFILHQMKARVQPFRDREDALDFFRVSAEQFIQSTAGADHERIAEVFDMDRIFAGPEQIRRDSPARPGFRYGNTALELSRDQRHHFNRLFEVYSKHKDDKVFERDHTPLLRRINRDIEQSYTPEQILLVQGVTEILIASSNYWKEHRTEWIQEISRLHNIDIPDTSTVYAGDIAANPCSAFPMVPMCQAINWGEVIEADGGGLIDGVVGNALYWVVVGPPGWLAGATILGGGVAAASTQELYHQIMDLL